MKHYEIMRDFSFALDAMLDSPFFWLSVVFLIVSLLFALVGVFIGAAFGREREAKEWSRRLAEANAIIERERHANGWRIPR